MRRCCPWYRTAAHAGDATAISTWRGFDTADAPDTLLEPALHDLAKYNAAKLAAMCVNLASGSGGEPGALPSIFARGMFGSGADYSWGERASAAGAADAVQYIE